MHFVIFSVSASVLGTSTGSMCMPILTQRAAHSVVTSKQVSSLLSASACLGPCMLLLWRFLSLIRLSLFLQGYRQLHLYFLALLATSSCFASSLDTSRPACIVTPASVEVATSLAASCTWLWRATPYCSRCLLALASNQSIAEFHHAILLFLPFLPKLPYAKRAEGIVITVRYPRYPWDTVTLLRYAKAL